jgi:hypothetical protein
VNREKFDEYFLVDGVLYVWGPWKRITSYMRIRYARKEETP